MRSSVVHHEPAPQGPPPLLPGDLAVRRLVPELMDDPGLPSAELESALRGIARLNLAGRAAAHVWQALGPVLRTNPGPLTVADFGCGRGDILRALHRRSRGRIAPVGIDVNAHSLRLARERGPEGAQWIQADLLADSAEPPVAGLQVDVAVSTLFLHHLDERAAVRLLAAMRASARRAVVVLDLHRNRTAWWTVLAGARLLTRSRIVHVDSGLSVCAAWKPGELLHLAREAGWSVPKVRQIFPSWLLLKQHIDKH